MEQLHAIGAWVVVAVVIGFGLVATALAALDPAGRGQQLLRIVRVLVGVLVGVEALLGVVLFVGGARPAEMLHLLYGLAILVVLPVAAGFADEAPPRPRAGVMAAAAVVQLLLIWRVYLTG